LKESIQALTPVNKAAFAEGFVQDAPGQPSVEAAAVRVGSGKGVTKLILDADGTLLGAYRFPDDPDEQRSLPLGAEQLRVLQDQWDTALGDQASCVPSPK